MKRFATMIFFLAVMLLVLCLPSFQATLSQLSTHISNEPGPPDVVDLYATFEFKAVGTELFPAVDKRADENVSGNQHSIAAIFFNAPDTLYDIPSSKNGQEPGMNSF